MKPKEKRWFTTVEVARHFEMGASTIRRLIETGELKAIRLGRWWRIPRSELERLEKRGLEVKG
ncbi:helix-turn-helix domain-containing protein [Oceanithermus sp.]